MLFLVVILVVSRLPQSSARFTRSLTSGAMLSETLTASSKSLHKTLKPLFSNAALAVDLFGSGIASSCLYRTERSEAKRSEAKRGAFVKSKSKVG